MVQRRRVKLPIKRRGASRKRISGEKLALLNVIDHLFKVSGCVRPKEASPIVLVRIAAERVEELNELERLLTDQINNCKLILKGLWSNKRLTRL